jgi:RNA polymerase sigma factor (sigma-70 family)
VTEAHQADQASELTRLFDEHRARLRAVAYRMLGSLTEAEDAVQDTWARFLKTGPNSVDNPGGWLTTVVSRVCLNALRARGTRREDPLGASMPDPVVCRDDGVDPETEALWADSVGLALAIMLDTLGPAERLAFVLHDLFDVPFEEIAPVVGRTPAAARQLASRARRRLQGARAKAPDVDLTEQRAVVTAFFDAARRGDIDGLVAVLDPEVVLRADGGFAGTGGPILLRGAAAVAEQARLGAQLGSRPGAEAHHVLVNGAAGVVIVLRGRPVAVVGFTVSGGRIVEIDGFTKAKRLRDLDVASLGL